MPAELARTTGSPLPSRPAPANRPARVGGSPQPGSAGLRGVRALVGRDLADRRPLRLPLLLDLAFGVVNLVVFLFISQLLRLPGDTELMHATSYFDFVAIGITFMLVLQAASTQLTARILAEQRSGTLEMLAAQPMPVWALALGLAGYPFLAAILRAGAYLLILGVLLGLRVGDADWLGVVLVLVTGSAAMMAIGVGLMAFTVGIGHGDLAARLIVVGLSFVSGTYFPASALPSVLPQLSALLPSRIALDGLRAAIGGGAWGGAALTLLGVTVLLLPLATGALHAALRRAARKGTLTRD